MYNYTDNQIKEAIKDSAAIMTTIGDRLGCSSITAEKYIRASQELTDMVNEERERRIDKAESVVNRAIDQNDIQTAKWYLSTIGKKRGFTEKTEIEHSGNIDIKEIVIKVAE